MKEPGFLHSEVAREPLTTERRVLLGFMAQPFVTALLGTAYLPLLALTDPRLRRSSSPPGLELALISGALIGGVGLLITVFAAAPMFYWLRGRGPVTWRHAVSSALLFANLLPTLLLGLSLFHGRDPRLSDFDFSAGAVRVIVLSSCIGTVSASIFWWIATGDLRMSLNPDSAESSPKRNRIP